MNIVDCDWLLSNMVMFQRVYYTWRSICHISRTSNENGLKRKVGKSRDEKKSLLRTLGDPTMVKQTSITKTVTALLDCYRSNLITIRWCFRAYLRCCRSSGGCVSMAATGVLQVLSVRSVCGGRRGPRLNDGESPAVAAMSLLHPVTGVRVRASGGSSTNRFKVVREGWAATARSELADSAAGAPFQCRKTGDIFREPTTRVCVHEPAVRISYICKVLLSTNEAVIIISHNTTCYE